MECANVPVGSLIALILWQHSLFGRTKALTRGFSHNAGPSPVLGCSFGRGYSHPVGRRAGGTGGLTNRRVKSTERALVIVVGVGGEEEEVGALGDGEKESLAWEDRKLKNGLLKVLSLPRHYIALFSM